MKTTLRKILKNISCESQRKDFLRKFGKTESDNCTIEILEILNLNGLDDALWSLRAVDGYEKEMRLFAVWCGKRVRENIKDWKSINAITVAEKFANGNASETDLMQAWINADNSFDGGWPADKSPARAAYTSAKWFAAIAQSNKDERQAQERQFRELLLSCRDACLV